MTRGHSKADALAAVLAAALASVAAAHHPSPPRAALAAAVAVYVALPYAHRHVPKSFTLAEAMACGQAAAVLVSSSFAALPVTCALPALLPLAAPLLRHHAVAPIAAVALAATVTLRTAHAALAALVVRHAALAAAWLGALAVATPLALALRSRKVFHVLALLLFAPPLVTSSRSGAGWDDPGGSAAFVAAASASVMSAFAAVEVLRGSLPVPAWLAAAVARVTDDRDTGTLVWSHAALLAGVCAPAWLPTDARGAALTWRLASGAAALGVGDTLASAVGRRYGKVRIAAGSPKTFEGAVAFAAGTAAVLFACAPAPDASTAARVVGAVASTALVEASTDQLDNLFVPLHLLVALDWAARGRVAVL